MPPTSLRFYFDYISPNAYIAWTQLPALAKRHGVAIEPVPVLFARLLEASGRLGPAEIPDQMRWMWKNVLRKATLLGVPFHPPAFHPFNPLLALRVSSLPLAEASRARLIEGLFSAVWARRLHVSDPLVVKQVADEIGLDGATLVAQADVPEAKALLRAQTMDAVDRAVFGVPTIEVGGELFWGYDDFPHLEMFLAGKDPARPADVREWSEPLQASAVRARQPRSAP
jgi:2-hydroxychromene-2-carboxylate isomerase